MVDALVIVPVEKGALNQLWAATGLEDQVCSGAYYQPVGKE